MPVLSCVSNARSVTTALASAVPMSMVMRRLTSPPRRPLASSAKPSAESSWAQAGASTDRSPEALREMVLSSCQVRRCTEPPMTMPSSAHGSAALGVPLPWPPRTSMSRPAIRSRPRRIWPLASITSSESPP